jgi:hypothetical protein
MGNEDEPTKILTQFEVHPQLSHNRHPMDGVLVQSVVIMHIFSILRGAG